MPVLILDDGRRLYDSRVILEYLDEQSGGNILLPVQSRARFEALTYQALGDGIMDAALLVVYEARDRPQHLWHEPWLDYQRGKILRGLAALADNAPDPHRFDVGTISLSCMLGYLDWRRQVEWRAARPALVEWLEVFRKNNAEFDQTAAP